MIDPAIGAALITGGTSLIIAIGVPIVLSIAYLIKHLKKSECLGSSAEFNQSNDNLKKNIQEYEEANVEAIQNTL